MGVLLNQRLVLFFHRMQRFSKCGGYLKLKRRKCSWCSVNLQAFTNFSDQNITQKPIFDFTCNADRSSDFFNTSVSCFTDRASMQRDKEQWNIHQMLRFPLLRFRDWLWILSSQCANFHRVSLTFQTQLFSQLHYL